MLALVTLPSLRQNPQHSQLKREVYFDSCFYSCWLAMRQNQDGRGVWRRKHCSPGGGQEAGRESREPGRRTFPSKPRPRDHLHPHPASWQHRQFCTLQWVNPLLSTAPQHLTTFCIDENSGKNFTSKPEQLIKIWHKLFMLLRKTKYKTQQYNEPYLSTLRCLLGYSHLHIGGWRLWTHWFWPPSLNCHQENFWHP